MCDCIGISQLERWERAKKLAKNPPWWEQAKKLAKNPPWWERAKKLAKNPPDSARQLIEQHSTDTRYTVGSLMSLHYIGHILFTVCGVDVENAGYENQVYMLLFCTNYMLLFSTNSSDVKLSYCTLIIALSFI